MSRKDKVDLLAPSYFVPRSRPDEFEPEEIVFDGAEAPVYKKGTFIYRLAGRDREKSASYYTPEPLARLLVKHALMERCKDLTADEILELKILEPAMGSAAFLVETTNQLADLYLERKQKEMGRTIPQDQIIIEKQRCAPLFLTGTASASTSTRWRPSSGRSRSGSTASMPAISRPGSEISSTPGTL